MECDRKGRKKTGHKQLLVRVNVGPGNLPAGPLLPAALILMASLYRGRRPADWEVLGPGCMAPAWIFVQPESFGRRTLRFLKSTCSIWSRK